MQLGGACATFLAEETRGARLLRGQSLGLLELYHAPPLLHLVLLLPVQLILLKSDVANEVFVRVEVGLVQPDDLRGVRR